MDSITKQIVPVYDDDRQARHEAQKVSLELIKQLLTLSTVVLGLSVRFVQADVDQSLLILKTGIVGMLISVFAGIFALANMSYLVRKNQLHIMYQKGFFLPAFRTQFVGFAFGAFFLSVFVLFG
jgi:hypothetical protein